MKNGQCPCPICQYERVVKKRKALNDFVTKLTKEEALAEMQYKKHINALQEELKTPMERQTEKPPYALNFCRVFELPDRYPEGYCFSGGKPVTMLMVDWFNPWPDNPKLKTWEDVTKLLLPFLRSKIYVKPNKRYILITDFGASLIFEKETENQNG